MTPEDQARVDYVDAFVKEHHLGKALVALRKDRGDYLQWDLATVERAQRAQGMVGIVYDPDYATNPEGAKWFVNLTDLSGDDPPADRRLHGAWERYQSAVRNCKEYQELLWLAAETEHKRVVAEAKLRSYGIAVVS